MDDKVWRQKGREIWGNVRYYAKDQENLEAYFNAISNFRRIQEKSICDKEDISELCRLIAIQYFNIAYDQKSHKEESQANENFKNAIMYYTESINVQLSVPMSDEKYREMILNCLDRADAYIQLGDAESANKSNWDGVQMFRYISQKTPAECMLGNPIDNFEKFHMFYEKKSSGTRFLTSTAFKNDQRLFVSNNEMRKKEEREAKDEIDTMVDQLQNIGIEQKIENEIIHMFNALTLSNNEMQKSTQTDPGIAEDGKYRSLAMQYLQIGWRHLKTGIVQDICVTHDQALNALKRIGHKTPKDIETINQLTKQVYELKLAVNKKPVIQSIFQENNAILLQNGSEVNYETDMDLETGIGFR